MEAKVLALNASRNKKAFDEFQKNLLPNPLERRVASMDLLMREDSIGLRKKWTQEQNDAQCARDWEELATQIDRLALKD